MIPDLAAPHDPIAEGDQLEQFRKIRNRLRLVNPFALLGYALLRAHSQWNSAFTDRDLPWHVLLMMKWAFRYGDPNPVMTLGIPEAYRLTYNDIHDLSGSISVEPLPIFLKAMGHQQLGIQGVPNYHRLARTVDVVSRSQELTRWIEAEAGMEIDVLAEITFLALALLPRTPFCGLGHFAPVLDRLRIEHVARVLALLSVSSGQLYSAALEDRPRPLAEEIFSANFMQERPLLRVPDGSCASFFMGLSARALEYFPVDLVARRDRGRAGRLLGGAFERYVGELVGRLEGVLSEREIQRTAGRRKIVDFSVIDGDAVLLIECKAGHLSERAGPTFSPSILRNSLRDILEKAVIQAVSTALALGAENRDVFLLVVTFREWHLGPVAFLLEGEWRRRLEEKCRQEGLDPSVLPSCRIFFESVETLEALTSKSASASDLISVFRRASEDYGKVSSAKHSLRMYAEDAEAHPLVMEAVGRYTDAVTEHLRRKDARQRESRAS